MADDAFSASENVLTGPVEYSRPVTTDDSTDLPAVTRALLVAAAGTVKVTYRGGQIDTVYLIAGTWHPMRVVRVWEASTATGIHAGF